VYEDPGLGKEILHFALLDRPEEHGQRRCIYLSHTYVFMYQYRYPITGTATDVCGSRCEVFYKEKPCRSRHCEILQ
jgi:hypothetical protein